MLRRFIITLVIVLLLAGGFFAWVFLGPSVKIKDDPYLYIPTGSTYADVQQELVQQGFLSGTSWFNMAARAIGYDRVRPGRYEMKKGMSVVSLVRMLRNGQQSPVNFAITKKRTKEGLAAQIAAAFEPDSLQVISFLNNQDSLTKYGLDTNTVMAAAMPYTYSLKWNTSPRSIFEEFHKSWKKFWTDERKEKAGKLGLKETEVSTLASIIDEETNAPSDRPNIASVYLNRIAKGMPLQADPTLKFALKDFGIRRIMDSHKNVESPYNTYKYKGLPPGPICTPATATLDAVLDSPKTEYLYFVANSDFSGTHVFTTNYDDHLKYARLYQQELNKRNIR